MTRITRAIERRFVVPGRAVSFRSPHALRYKKLVRSVAHGTFPRTVSTRPFEVFLDYFHSAPRRVDMDNVAKCVLDALTGIAYVDDQQVQHQASQSHDLTRPLFLQGGPVDLVKPLAEHTEYLFVRVRAVATPTTPRGKSRG